MSNHYNRDYCEELFLNNRGSITKAIHNIDVHATPEQIKDIVLCNHSNLKAPSQRLYALILSNRNQMKPCRHITASMNHILNWHTHVSQLMMTDPGQGVSSMQVHSMAN